MSRFVTAILGLCALVLLQPALAEPVEDEYRYRFRIGAFLTDAAGRFGISRTNQDAPLLDFDRNAIDDDDETLLAGLTWEISERWRMDFIYFSTDYAGQFDLAHELIWDRQSIPLGARVNTGLEADFLIAQAGYSLYRTESSRSGLGFGLHIVDFGAFIKARLTIGEDPVFEYASDIDYIAPLPNVYGFLEKDLTDRLTLLGYAGYFSLSYDDNEGELLTADLSLEYLLNKRLAIGVGYNILEIDVEIDKSDSREIYDVDFDGLKIYLSYQF